MKRTSYAEITSYTNTTPSLLHYRLDYRSYDMEVEYPQTEAIFHPKEGLPIKLNPNNFTNISTACRHGIVHSFDIPVQSHIEWKIEDGLNDGAFKIGYATNAKYAARDVGDSVIYYPPRQELEPEEKKEIQISVIVRNNDITIKNRNRKANEINNDITKKFTIILVIQRVGGIRMSYSATVRIKKIELGGDQEKTENGLINSMTANDDNNNNKENLLVPFSKENDKMTTTKIESLNKSNFCNDCKIQIVFEPPTRENIQMQLQGYFLTSEYIKIPTIKINDNSSSDENGCLWLKGEVNQRCKIADVSPKATLVWECTSGSFPCGNNGESIIYLTPSEHELSKSPVTITLYTFYSGLDYYNVSGTGYNIKRMIDSKRIWLLRRPFITGG